VQATAHLSNAVYEEGDYEQVVELTTRNIRAWPGDWSSPYPGSAPPPIHTRFWLALSLAQLGRFSEAAGPEAEMIRLAEETQNSWAMGSVYYGVGVIRLFVGDHARARSLLERAISECRMRSVVLTSGRPFLATPGAGGTR
jgi:hypothetical protein